MDCVLNAVEVRILGALIEKELTTPEYYPLSLNALVNAGNQKSNRDPIMNLTDEEAEKAIEVLRKERLAWRRGVAGARVSKYEHNLNSKYILNQAQLAIMGVLLLRGAQTPGEIRIRTARMHEFTSLEDVVQTLEALSKNEAGALAIELPRQPGHKESRYMHCMAGIPEVTELVHQRVLETGASSQERLDIVENEVAELRQKLIDLTTQFEAFRKSFE
jgi:uncharacterized protein YceH (UPF0502 family)